MEGILGERGVMKGKMRKARCKERRDETVMHERKSPVSKERRNEMTLRTLNMGLHCKYVRKINERKREDEGGGQYCKELKKTRKKNFHTVGCTSRSFSNRKSFKTSTAFSIAAKEIFSKCGLIAVRILYGCCSRRKHSTGFSSSTILQSS